MKSILILSVFMCLNIKSNAFGLDSLKGNFYRDLDYFRLEGISKMASNELDRFPYYRVTEIDEEHRVVEFINRNSSTAELYEKVDDYWVSKNIQTLSTHLNYVVTYVLNDKIIQLFYAYMLPENEIDKEAPSIKNLKLNKKYRLFRINVKKLTEQAEYTMNIKNAKWIEPSPKIEDLLKAYNWQYVNKSTFEITNDHILKKSYKDSNGEELICTDLTDKWGFTHNMFWLYCFYRAPIDCK